MTGICTDPTVQDCTLPFSTNRPKDVQGCPAAPEEFSFTAFLALFLFAVLIVCVWVCWVTLLVDTLVELGDTLVTSGRYCHRAAPSFFPLRTRSLLRACPRRKVPTGVDHALSCLMTSWRGIEIRTWRCAARLFVCNSCVGVGVCGCVGVWVCVAC